MFAGLWCAFLWSSEGRGCVVTSLAFHTSEMPSVSGVCGTGLAEVHNVLGIAGALWGTSRGTQHTGHPMWDGIPHTGHPTWNTPCGAPRMGHSTMGHPM